MRNLWDKGAITWYQKENKKLKIELNKEKYSRKKLKLENEKLTEKLDKQTEILSHFLQI